jgi:hypothetical protein
VWQLPAMKCFNWKSQLLRCGLLFIVVLLRWWWKLHVYAGCAVGGG